MSIDPYQSRRKILMRMMGPRSIAIMPAAPHHVRNRDVHYPYRPDSDFHYMTGFHEPDAVAVLIPGRSPAEYILFCREKDEKRELWDGPVVGQEDACARFKAGDSFPINDLDDILPGLLEQCEKVYYAMGCNPELDQKLPAWINQIRLNSRSGVHGPLEFIALDHYLHEMRVFKDASEIAKLKKAINISAKAHQRLLQVCRPGLKEYELEAEFRYTCARLGAREQAYSPIVGGGVNGCVLHYIDNQAELREGDLVLVDAGCEYEYYASDITRTFPVSGEFSAAQRALYELVLETQAAAIAKAIPGNHWNDPHDAAVQTITRGLKHLGLLRGRSIKKLIEDESYKSFYMHKTGHWLGMDVHDVGDYKIDGEWRLLEAGMTLTIEPGLYIGPHSSVDPQWRGIGIRIEDDLWITDSGPEILSHEAPKTVQEIESWMARH